jgi:hypothetical protein
MGLHDPFGHLKYKLWPKEMSGVKLAIWLPTIKSQESPWFSRVQVMCDISLESSQKGLQLCFKPHLNHRSCTQSYGPPKLKESQLWEISGLPLENPKTKWHLGADTMAMHRVYYKGEGGGFPQVWAMVSLVSPSSPMACPSTKSVPILH